MNNSNNNNNGNSSEFNGTAAVFSALLLWGILPVYWKQMVNIPPDQILANRVIWSFIFVLFLMFLKGNLKSLFLSEIKKKDNIILFLSGLILSSNWFTYIYSVNTGHIVEASLGYYINPLLTIFLGRIIFKEKMEPSQFVAVILAAIGVGVITFNYGSVPFLALILAFTFAMYSLVKKKVKIEVTQGLALETLVVLPIAVGYLVFLSVNGQSIYSGLSSWELFFLVGTGVFTGIPLILFSFGARKIPLTTVGFIQYLAPTLSLFLGIFLYNEPFTIIHLVTFSFIWAALFLYSFSQLRLFSRSKRAGLGITKPE